MEAVTLRKSSLIQRNLFKKGKKTLLSEIAGFDNTRCDDSESSSDTSNNELKSRSASFYKSTKTYQYYSDLSSNGSILRDPEICSNSSSSSTSSQTSSTSGKNYEIESLFNEDSSIVFKEQ